MQIRLHHDREQRGRRCNRKMGSPSTVGWSGNVIVACAFLSWSGVGTKGVVDISDSGRVTRLPGGLPKGFRRHFLIQKTSTVPG